MSAASPEEVTLRGVFRQFMPMLLTALSQGGDGYGLAATVITVFGRPTYDQAFGFGKDKIMQLIKAEPDLWAKSHRSKPNSVDSSSLYEAAAQSLSSGAADSRRMRPARQPASPSR
jgi:hypothetical protein